jgi:hypothetical protein
MMWQEISTHTRTGLVEQVGLMTPYIYKVHKVNGGTQWRSWLRYCATFRKVAGSIPDGIIGIFHGPSFWLHYGLGVDSASNRNEYKEYFLGVKAAGVYG